MPTSKGFMGRSMVPIFVIYIIGINYSAQLYQCGIIIIQEEKMKIRGVFFDLFGTLFIYGDMKKAWDNWLHHFHASMRDCGLPLSIDEFSVECDKFFGKAEPTLEETDMTVFEKRIKALSVDLNMTISKNDISSIADLIAGKWQEEIHLDPDAIPTIRHLKKEKTIGLVSNFDHPPHVQRCLLQYDMHQLFDTIVISGEVGVKKPNPRIFDRALVETRMCANEVAYVGDTEEDVLAAKAAAMKPVLIQRKDAGTDATALDFSVEQMKTCWSGAFDVSTITSLPELISLLEL
jgi:putative hydrolase of the HAD superfamily